MAVGTHGPGDVRSYSFGLFNPKWLVIAAFSLTRASRFCWFQSPIDLCRFLPTPPPRSLRASLDVAAGEFSGVYLCCHPLPRGGVPVEGWHPGTPQLQPVRTRPRPQPPRHACFRCQPTAAPKLVLVCFTGLRTATLTSEGELPHPGPGLSSEAVSSASAGPRVNDTTWGPGSVVSPLCRVQPGSQGCSARGA